MFPITIDLAVALVLFAAGVQTPAATFLFDATKAEMAGNADWVIDGDLHNLKVSSTSNGSGEPDIGGNESNPQRIPTPPASGITTNTDETYWDGALSAWAVDLAKLGHAVETLPYNGRITFQDPANPQDLTNYEVFVLVEPNIEFTEAEKAAIINFVYHGGALFLVSDHDGSDRNNDGFDSVQILNDLMTNSIASNPFGIQFNSDNLVVTSSNVDTAPGNPFTFGPSGTATDFAYHNGATMTLNTNQNNSVRAVIWSASLRSTNNVMLAYANYGAGRVMAAGDSSPFDDGTGDPADSLFNGYDEATDKTFILNASLWLVGRPRIIQSPKSQTVISGSNVTFTVTASGEPDLSFEWWRDGTNYINYNIVSGSTNSSLKLFGVTSNSQDNFSVVVSNAYGSVTSAVATLTVLTPPSIILQPRSQTNLIGTTATFHVGAAGDIPLTFQWRKEGNDVAAATNATFTLANVQSDAADDYTVVIANHAGSVTSAVARLTINTAPAIGGSALPDVQSQFSYVAYVSGEVGFAFRPAANLAITNLGFTFDGVGVPASYSVQIRNAAGSALASVVFSAGHAPASQFVYSNIPPVNLAAGSLNYLTFYDANYYATNGTKFWVGRLIDETQPDSGSFDVAPELGYLGATIDGNLIAGNLASFYLFVGPGFQFAASAAVQPSRLEIILSAPHTVKVFWPATDTLGRLQTAPGLSTAMTNVIAVPIVIGSNNVVELPATATQTFFRLIYP